jgi:glycosyltransferase involved in cell wall biosynthesis
MKACDLILVGSDFHKRLIHNQLGIDDYRIVVVGLPIHQDELERFWTPWHERERLVVFPHRLAPEKNPQWWDHLQVLLKEKAKIVCEFATTAKDCETKEDYYKMLGKSKVAVSFADQETFGIAMQEAIALGCWAVAPNRLSYPELIDESNGYLFDDIFQAVDKVAYGLMKPNPPKWNQRHENAIARAGLVIKDRLGDGKI